MARTVFDTAFYPGEAKALEIGNAWAVYIGGAAFAGSGWTPEAVASLREKADTFPVYVPAQTGFSADRAAQDSSDILAKLHDFGYSSGVVFVDMEGSAVSADPAGAAAYVSALGPIVNAAGFRFGLYSSKYALMLLQPSLTRVPDAVWVGEWQFTSPQDLNPHQIPGYPDNLYELEGQRAWQYAGIVGSIPTVVAGVEVDISSVDDSLLIPATPPAAPAPAPATATPPAPAPERPSTYTIKAGDTLWALENQFGLAHGSLFQANSAYLDQNAHARGFGNSEEGRLIWPGETINVP